MAIILNLGRLENLINDMAKLSKICQESKYLERIELSKQIKEKYGIPVFGPGFLPDHIKVAIIVSIDCDVYIYIPGGEKQ